MHFSENMFFQEKSSLVQSTNVCASPTILSNQVQRFISGFMDWIPSASRYNQSEALITDKRFSKGDPLEFSAVSVIEVVFRHLSILFTIS